MVERQNTRPVTLSEKILAAAHDLLSIRQQNSSPSVSFSAAGAILPSNVVELPGFIDNYLSCEGSDDNKIGHVDVVALSQQEADKASKNMPSRSRDNKQWSKGFNLHRMLIGEHLHAFLYIRCSRRIVDSRYLV